MPKLSVAVVRGGPSSEHDVSLSSAASVVENLDKSKYTIIDAFVSRDGKWSIDGGALIDDLAAIDQMIKQKIDVVFLAIHGTYGEDGVLQEKLEKAGLCFTGSGSKASHLAFDKSLAEKVYKQNELLVPNSQVVSSSDETVEIKPPLVVKPVSQGSSVGVTIVKDENEVVDAIKEAFRHDTHILIQEFIRGREVSCGVVEKDQELIGLPPTEIIPKTSEFYDYDAKYIAGASDEITPPDMSPEVISQIQNLAKQAHVSLGCRGYSRTDMFVTEDDQIYMIETNTLPGMTPTSILPQQAQVYGMDFSQLLDLMIESALKYNHS